jgi:hypothetical protein
MLAVALEAEPRAWLDDHADVIGADGKRLVVGNGYHRERTVVTGAGEVEVRAPRAHDKRGEPDRERFVSSILPPYMRRSPKVTEVLPILYLRGLSTGDFTPTLRGTPSRLGFGRRAAQPCGVRLGGLSRRMQRRGGVARECSLSTVGVVDGQRRQPGRPQRGSYTAGGGPLSGGREVA